LVIEAVPGHPSYIHVMRQSENAMSGFPDAGQSYHRLMRWLRSEERLSKGAAAAVILGLSILAWVVLIAVVLALRCLF